MNNNNSFGNPCFESGNGHVKRDEFYFENGHVKGEDGVSKSMLNTFYIEMTMYLT